MPRSEQNTIALVDRYKDQIWSAIEDPVRYRQKLEELPSEVPEAIAAWWLVAEVENGGFPQYFENSYGAMITEAIRGFEVTDRYEYARAARRAAQKFGMEVPVDRNARSEIVEKLESENPEVWEDVTSIFYSVTGDLYIQYEANAEMLAARLLTNGNN